MAGRGGIRVKATSRSRALVASERARLLARDLGFDEVDQAKVSTAVAELAMNIVVHAGGKGTVAVRGFSDGDRKGIVVEAYDRGPGMADVTAATEGGGAGGGLGYGLGGVKRLMDEVNISSAMGRGTRITAKKMLA